MVCRKSLPIETNQLQLNSELDEDDNERYRPLNLHLHPFYLPPPVCQTHEDVGLPFSHIAFWELDSLDGLDV